MGSETANAKISGYLEKKGKFRMVAGWKKYWFVLEGRLLLYYRSKEEYEGISPCKGSISLGPKCCIKPTLASTCIFQIETRSNTITLRAENRLEQDKWMQGILNSLNQNPNSPTKLSYFRYSADDLAKSKVTSNGSNKKHKTFIFSRQNTMPSRVNTKTITTTTTKDSESSDGDDKTTAKVIEKLRKCGAHSYVGSLNDIHKVPLKAVSPKLPKSQALKRMISNSSQPNLPTTNEESLKTGSTTSVNPEDTESPYARLIDINKRSESSQKLGSTSSVMIENSEYVTDKIIYTEPNVEVIVRDGTNKNRTDVNKNSVIIDNIDYIPSVMMSTENHYDTCEYTQKKFASSTDKIYQESEEDPYSTVPTLPPPRVKTKSSSFDQLPTVSSGSPSGQAKKKSSTFRRISNLVSNNSDSSSSTTSSVVSTKKNSKLGRRRSFVGRVFNKIKSSGSKQQPQEVLESPTSTIIEKEGVDRDVVDRGLVDRGVVDRGVVETRIPEIETLREMEEILTQKKEDMKKGLQKETDYTRAMASGKNNLLQEQCVTINYPRRNSRDFEEKEYYQPKYSKEYKPSLPPRQRNLTPQHYYPNHYPTKPPNIPLLPLPREPFFIPRLKLKRPRNCTTKPTSEQHSHLREKLKTIDEILDDLDREKCLRESVYENCQRRRQLQVDEDRRASSTTSDTDSITTDVIMRNTSVLGEFMDGGRHSEDLNRLLEELCKVTSAPVLSANAGSSLVYRPETREEWVKLIPVRKRRHSDPDYDVPRPHSVVKFVNSLALDKPETEVIQDNKPKGDDSTPKQQDITLVKPTLREVPSSTTSVEEDRSIFSYTSHRYTKELPTAVATTLTTDDPKHHVIYEDFTYASPRSFISFDHMTNKCEHIREKHAISSEKLDRVNNNEEIVRVNEDEVFADSLEPFEQVSTEF